MYWPKFSMKKLMRKLGGKTPSGVACSYVKWTSAVGLKIFTVKKARTTAARLQRRAAKAGLAPNVGESIDFPIINFHCSYSAPILKVVTLYAYFTEHARITPGYHRSTRKIRALQKGLAEIGIDHDDLHTNNVGICRKKLVCIDFDPVSVELESLF